jgi:hypothetical protein
MPRSSGRALNLLLIFALVPGPATSLAVAAPEAAAPGAPAARPFPEDFDALLRESWRALRMGDSERAMLGYERVLARADDSRVQVRALISIAIARLLPSSSAFDPEAGQLAMEELERRIRLYGLEQEFFGQVELLRLVASQDRELKSLREGNARLKKDLAARDRLLKELRALSVEQP